MDNIKRRKKREEKNLPRRVRGGHGGHGGRIRKGEEKVVFQLFLLIFPSVSSVYLRISSVVNILLSYYSQLTEILGPRYDASGSLPSL